MWWTAPAPGGESPEGDRCYQSHQGAVHMQITTIGLDIAKNVFQVHGIDAAEKVVVRKQLRRSKVIAFFEALPPCLVGMEACASAHYWARELRKLVHEVCLMPAKDVKAYVKPPATQNHWAVAFSQRLRTLGWSEGSSVAIEYRWAE